MRVVDVVDPAVARVSFRVPAVCHRIAVGVRFRPGIEVTGFHLRVLGRTGPRVEVAGDDPRFSERPLPRNELADFREAISRRIGIQMGRREMDIAAMNMNHHVDGCAVVTEHSDAGGVERIPRHHEIADASRLSCARRELVVPLLPRVLLHQIRHHRGAVIIGTAVPFDFIERNDVGLETRGLLDQPVGILLTIRADTAVMRIPLQDTQRRTPPDEDDDDDEDVEEAGGSAAVLVDP